MALPTDLTNYRAPDLERIGAGTFITGFAWGVLTLAFLLACFDWLV